MNFGNLLYMQPDNIKRNLRNIETSEKKLANAKIAVILNNTCLNIYIYIYAFRFQVDACYNSVFNLSK